MNEQIEKPFSKGEHESERASNSYLMSTVAIVAGLPLPIVNLLATLFFYVGNRNASYFVRWHCLQALFSQLSLLCVNSCGFWWTVSIIFGSNHVSNSYIAYILTVVIFNSIDFVATIRAAVLVRQGKHVEWWFYASLVSLVCKKRESDDIFKPLF